jgi:hypothetical protein
MYLVNTLTSYATTFATQSHDFVTKHVFNRACSIAPAFLACEKTAKIATGSILALASLRSAIRSKTLKSKFVFTTLSAIGATLAISEIYSRFFTPAQNQTTTATIEADADFGSSDTGDNS